MIKTLLLFLLFLNFIFCLNDFYNLDCLKVSDILVTVDRPLFFNNFGLVLYPNGVLKLVNNNERFEREILWESHENNESPMFFQMDRYKLSVKSNYLEIQDSINNIGLFFPIEKHNLFTKSSDYLCFQSNSIYKWRLFIKDSNTNKTKWEIFDYIQSVFTDSKKIRYYKEYDYGLLNNKRMKINFERYLQCERVDICSIGEIRINDDSIPYCDYRVSIPKCSPNGDYVGCGYYGCNNRNGECLGNDYSKCFDGIHCETTSQCPTEYGCIKYECKQKKCQLVEMCLNKVIEYEGKFNETCYSTKCDHNSGKCIRNNLLCKREPCSTKGEFDCLVFDTPPQKTCNKIKGTDSSLCPIGDKCQIPYCTKDGKCSLKNKEIKSNSFIQEVCLPNFGIKVERNKKVLDSEIGFGQPCQSNNDCHFFKENSKCFNFYCYKHLASSMLSHCRINNTCSNDHHCLIDGTCIKK
ncbi:hypothetical protein ACTA71_006958 [Dictyostelium dimigraforme]